MEWINLLAKIKVIALIILIILLIIFETCFLIGIIKQKQNEKKLNWLYRNGFIMIDAIWFNRETKEKLTCDEVCKMSYKKLINRYNC